MVLVETIERDEVTITFRLGRNAAENHDIIDDSDPNDLWFHLDGFPSGHCILEVRSINNVNLNNDFTSLDPNVSEIAYAANLVRSYSKLKNHNKKIKVIYCQVKNIKKGKSKCEVNILNLKKTNFILV